jgi:carbonic anhydrase
MSRIIFGGATRIIQGVQKFQRRIFGKKEALFQRLGEGQSPLALLITCSDSRINPNLLTQTEPGELFILRNAGNLVPPYGDAPSGEAATVEYALHHLHVRDVIVCGHSRCGAIQGLLAPRALEAMPQVKRWLEFARPVLDRLPREDKTLSPATMLGLAVEQNTLVQVEHLQTYPVVQEALVAGKLRLHAWVYHFETGKVTAHVPGMERFVPLEEAPRQQWVKQPPAPAESLGELGDSI